MAKTNVQYAHNLKLGDKIRLGRVNFSNKNSTGVEEIVWRVISKDHNTLDAKYPASSLTLIADKVVRFQAYDAKEPSNPNTDRANYGNNRYPLSNIRQWLNSDKGFGVWYTPQNISTSTYSKFDTPPNMYYIPVGQGNYGYESDAGFLFHWEAWEKNLLKQTTITAVAPSIDSGAQYETMVDKVFLPSVMELDGYPLTYTYGTTITHEEGKQFPYFNTNQIKAAGATQLAWENSPFYFNNAIPSTGKFDYWMRSRQDGQDAVFTVSPTGIRSYTSAYTSAGIRPVINITNTAIVTLTPDTNGVYSVLPNIAPVVTIEKQEGLKVDYSVKDFNGTVKQVKIFFNGLEKETLLTNFNEVKSYTIPYPLTVKGINELRFETLDDQNLKGTQTFNVYVENNLKVPKVSEKVVVDNQMYTVNGIIDNNDGTVGLQLNANLTRNVPKGQVFEKMTDDVVPHCSVTNSLNAGEYLPMELKSVSYEDNRTKAVEEWELNAEGSFSHFKVKMKRETSANEQYVSKVSQVYSFKDEIQ